MAGCSCTCRCGRKFDKFSGYLVNLDDWVLKKLKEKPAFQEILKEYTVDGKTKHFVLCSDCVEELLGEKLMTADFKYKGGQWMTSNAAYFLRRLNLLTPENIERLKKMDDGGVVPFEKKQWKFLYESFKKN